jgi:glyoxylase-like metal-dependent hydrolase (beta-lactamase superfamily II)
MAIASRLLTALAVLVAWVGFKILTKPPLNVPEPVFKEIRPGLSRLSYDVSFTPLIVFPVAVFLVHTGDDNYVLIDTGLEDALVPRQIQSALTANGGTLKMILLTHGHQDHVGNLPQLLQQYPDVKVGLHEAEAPFVTTGQGYSIEKGDHLAWNIAKYMPNGNATGVPEDRAVYFKGLTGDVADAFTFVNWLPKGVLEYVHTPGHTDGHVSFIHQPSESMIAGDILFNINDRRSKEPTLAGPIMFVSNNHSALRDSQQKAADLDLKMYYPSHDNATGVEGQAVKEFALVAL